MTRAQRVWLTIGVTTLSVVGYVGVAFAFFKYGGFLFSQPEPEHVHAFGEWTVEKEATCTEEGELVRTCTCGEKETQPIEKTAHSFGEWHVAKEPTCTAYGREERECACGAKETDLIAKTEHEYKLTFEGFSVSADGKVTATGIIGCAHPNDDLSIEVDLSQGLHFTVKEVHEATCTEAGWTVYSGYYEYEGHKVVGEYTYTTDPATHHSVTEWTVTTAPTNDSEGEAVGHCENCDEDIHVVLPDLMDTCYQSSGTEQLCGTNLTYYYKHFDEEQLVQIDMQFVLEQVDHVWGEWRRISEIGYDGPYKWVRQCLKEPEHMEFSDSEEKPED